MFLNLKILHANDILAVTPEGNLDFERAKEIIAELVSLKNVPKDHVILLDFRKSHVALSIADIWELTKELAKHRQAFQRKFAVLVSDYEFDDAHFFETASRNIGFPMHATTDFEDAIKWLACIECLE